MLTRSKSIVWGLQPVTVCNEVNAQEDEVLTMASVQVSL